MEQQLENTIRKLKEVLPNKAPHAITVMNKDNLQKVVCNQTGAELAETYGSVEGFFEHLHANGINNVRIYDRKKSGSAFKAMGEYDRSFKTKDSTAEPMKEAIAPIVHQAQPIVASAGTFGLNGIQGLGFADIYKLQDHTRLQTECSDYKAENRMLKEQLEKLKEENLRNDILGTKSVEKASANNDLVEKLMPLAMAIGNKFLAPSGQNLPGLNGASLSPIRQQFVNIAQNADENLLTDLAIVIQGMQIPEFDEELTELCKKHKLISD